MRENNSLRRLSIWISSLILLATGGRMAGISLRAGIPLLALLLGSGCTTAALAWAPRYPGPERPHTDPNTVRVVDIGRPDCEYEVIGSVFGSSLDALRKAAAAHGGDGIYDHSCVVEARDHVYFISAHGTCAGRVFACKDSKTPQESRS